MSEPNPPCDLVAGPFPAERGMKEEAFYRALEVLGFPPVNRWVAQTVLKGELFGLLLEWTPGWEIKIFRALETYGPTGAVIVEWPGEHRSEPPA